MNIPGTAPLGGLLGGSGGQAGANAQQSQEQMMIRYMSAAMESCPAKTVLAGTMGFGLGGAFGLFMSSMRYDTPMSTGVNSATSTISSLPLKEQLRHGLKDMGRASWSSAKNFGKVGAIFSGTECCIEGLRGRNEISNGIAAGCMTGGMLAYKAGPQAAAVGCLGFAAFSAAIDTYMRQPSEPATGGRID